MEDDATTGHIIARMTLTPQDRVYLAHSEVVTVDITDHPELVRLRGEVERLRAAIVAVEMNEWWQDGERRLDCPSCGEVSADGLDLPHGMGCVWWEITQETK